MTDLRDAAKLALKALETVADEVFSPYNDPIGEAILALRRALAEDAMNRMAENARELGLDYGCPNCASLMEQNTELDKKLAEWVGLTEDEFFELAPVWFERETSLIDFVAMVEAKLKEKNT